MRRAYSLDSRHARVSGHALVFQEAQLHEQLHQPFLRRDVVFQARCEVGIAKLIRETLPEAFPRPRVVRQTQVAPDDVFQQANRRLFSQHCHHPTQHRPHRVTPFCGGTDVTQPYLVAEDLLNNERRHGLGQLRPELHRPQAERDVPC